MAVIWSVPCPVWDITDTGESGEPGIEAISESEGLPEEDSGDLAIGRSADAVSHYIPVARGFSAGMRREGIP
ncbi:MAG: hypothetical protein LGR52_10275 [Candidatus Thiosymbion ectosymbiont of Robbea hypermnestra]|nr:hypothetical protein [Candidatus Thiosymbion ectosymbiont of Robbea hypermnestra]